MWSHLCPIYPRETEQQQFQQSTGRQQDSLPRPPCESLPSTPYKQSLRFKLDRPQSLVLENPKSFLPGDALSRVPLSSSSCLCAIAAPNLQDPECSRSDRMLDCPLQPLPATLVGTGFKNRTKKTGQ